MKYVMTKRDQAILIFVFGIAVVVLTYMLVYKNLTEKTEVLKSTNNALQSRVDVLQSIADQQAELVATTNSNNQTAEEILTRFPANIYEEDVILFAGALQEFAPFESIPSVGIGAPQVTYEFENIAAQTDEIVNGYIPAQVTGAGPTPAEAPSEGEGEAVPASESAPTTDRGPTPVLYSRNVNLGGETDYDGFKNAIRFVVDNLDRSNLMVNASYDMSTGMVNTSLNIGRYYAEGTGRAYIEPEINNVVQGTDNIFGTISLEELRGTGGSTRTEGEASEAETE